MKTRIFFGRAAMAGICGILLTALSKSSTPHAHQPTRRRQPEPWGPGGSAPTADTAASAKLATGQQAYETSSWRWRESNPRPSVHHQGFSGCSLLCFSQPRRSRRQAADGLSRC